MPKPPAPPSLPLPGGKSVYELAKEACSDPKILEFVPPDQRDDPEFLAKMAEGFAPTGHAQEVHDGCLAGLRSQGL